MFDNLAAFLTLTLLELVLGIDNIVFLSILADKAEEGKRDMVRKIGLGLAMVMRIALLMVLAWIIGLTRPLFEVLGNEISWRDIILIAGGLFLIWKSTREIHGELEHEDIHSVQTKSLARGFWNILIQIAIIDMVFSLDSIITAVGMVDEIPIMVAAIITSVALMMVFARPVGDFVSKHPTVKMLALSFLFVIGVLLIADGFDHHIPKGYIYFAMAFSITVEVLNFRIRQKQKKAVQ